MPFFLFAFLFLLYPSSILGVRSFQDTKTHAFTFKYIVQLLHDPYLSERLLDQHQDQR